MTQYAFHFNSDVCTGCKTCQVACKETYKLPVNNLYRKVYNYQGGSWKPTEAGHYVPEGVFGYFVSLACNHCTNPACVANCPTGAMQKDEETGIVSVDSELCIGCESCIKACPYEGVRTLIKSPEYYLDVVVGEYDAPPHKGGTVEKCDFCAGRIDRGEKPACMELCPGRARYWGDLDDPESEVSQFLSGRNATVLLEEEGTSPSVYYVS